MPFLKTGSRRTLLPEICLKYSDGKPLPFQNPYLILQNQVPSLPFLKALDGGTIAKDALSCFNLCATETPTPTP